MIIFYCGECGVRLSVPAVEAGKTTRCTGCDARVPVPRTYFARPQIRFFCPACEARVRAWADQAGQPMRCPSCDAEMELPKLVGEVEEGVGVRGGDEPPEPDVSAERDADEERDDGPAEAPDAQPAEAAKPPSATWARLRRRIVRAIPTAVCLLAVSVPILTVMWLRSVRPPWLDHKLVSAAEGGSGILARLLLLSGAAADAIGTSGDTALCRAAEKGHAGLADLLLSYGAYVDLEDRQGRTPLLLAVAQGHADVARLMVGRGADVYFRRPTDGRGLLDIAIADGHDEIATLLLRKKEEDRKAAPVAYTLFLSPEEEAVAEVATETAAAPTDVPAVTEAQTPKPPTLHRPPSAVEVAATAPDNTRLAPVGFFMTYTLKTGIRRLWPARGDDPQKFLVIVFSGPLDVFKVTEDEYREIKAKGKSPTSIELTRSYDPKRFTILLPNGRKARAAALSPHWTPEEDTPKSDIFYRELNATYSSESAMRRGDLAVAWLLPANDCKPPFKIRVDGGESVPVPNIRFDGAETP